MQHFVATLFVLTTVASALTTSPCDQLRLAASYDAIVVGTGLGGSVAARRLAEWNPNWNILVVERGSSYAQCPACASSTFSYLFQSDPITGNYINSTVQPALGKSIAIKDTAVQGGGTSINSMIHSRGDVVRLFDDYFPANWNAYSMIAFYERYENYTFPPGFHRGYPWTYASELRGSTGPVVSSQQGPFYGNTRFLNALQSVYPNMPISYDTSINDGYMPGIGASYPESTSNGPKRVSAYSAYIQPYTGTNLKAITGTLTTKVLFDSSAQVTGVQLQLTRAQAALLGLGNQTLATCNVSTTKVVVASGSIGTPKLLKLSGVGPAAELAQFGIPVVSNVPGVGQNLRDHITVVLPIAPQNSSVQVPYSTNSINNYGWAYFNANDSVGVPNNFIFIQQSFSNTSMTNTVAGTNLKSSGNVTLRSTDPTVPPAVNPNYFGNPDDFNAVGIASMKSFNVSAQMGFVQSPAPCSVYPCQTPTQVVQAYNNYGLVVPGYHYVGTAALCNVTNPVSLRVKGTRGLYVLDASIIPYTPAANAESTVYAVSERGIDMINANMHSTYALQDLEDDAGWLICQFAPNVGAIQ